MIRKRGVRWQAVVKSGRAHVVSRTFDTRAEATAWERREKALLADGIDRRAGKQSVGNTLAHWLTEREPHISRKSLATDRSTVRQVPAWLLRREVGSVTETDIERLIGHWATLYAHSTVTRYRATVARFFAWTVAQRMRPSNPVTAVRVPRPRAPQVEMRPWSRDALEDVVRTIRPLNARAADCVLFLALTGLRWGEARALRVADIHQVPMQRLHVSWSQPESSGPPKATKSGKSRFVPLTNEGMEVVERLRQGKSSPDLLLTSSAGAQLHRTAFMRASHWDEVCAGHRIHDLRHTAATFWLEAGVPLTTVRQWLGHADISTTQRYVHWLGTDADRAAIDRLNHTGGDTGVTTAG